MPVYRAINVNIPLWGDGSSTVATVDLHAYLEALSDPYQHSGAPGYPVYPVVPLVALSYSTSSASISSVAVQGQSLEITFASAWTGLNGVNVQVGC